MSSGQPSVENGHSPELNQVSKMSGSWLELGRRAGRRPRRRPGPLGSDDDRHVAVRAVPGRDAVAPPQLARHVPVADVGQPVLPGLLEPLGQDPRPARCGSPRAPARRAAPVRMNHWVLSRGSMTSSLRWQRPMTISCGVVADEVAARLEVGARSPPGPRSGRARRSAVPVPGDRSRRRRGSSAPAGRGAGRSAWSSWSWAGRDLDRARSRTRGRRRRRR